MVIATIGRMADIIFLIGETTLRITIILLLAMPAIMVLMSRTGIGMTITQMISADIRMTTCTQRSGLDTHLADTHM